MLEIPFILAGLSGTAGPILLLFSWNWVCAPYRIERDARIGAENRIDELRQQLPQGPQPRELDDDEKASLADAIRNSGVKPQTISVTYDAVDAECADFAIDISDAIEMAGISTAVHDGVMVGRSVKDRGIKLYAGRSNGAKQLANVFFEQFQKFGYSPERRKTITDENFFIDVCRSGKRKGSPSDS